jgi:hypothetical protein
VVTVCDDGVAKSRGEGFANIKVCFTATDRVALEATLAELATLADCYWVKFTKQSKAGN